MKKNQAFVGIEQLECRLTPAHAALALPTAGPAAHWPSGLDPWTPDGHAVRPALVGADMHGHGNLAGLVSVLGVLGQRTHRAGSAEGQAGLGAQGQAVWGLPVLPGWRAPHRPGKPPVHLRPGSDLLGQPAAKLHTTPHGPHAPPITPRVIEHLFTDPGLREALLSALPRSGMWTPLSQWGHQPLQLSAAMVGHQRGSMHAPPPQHRAAHGHGIAQAARAVAGSAAHHALGGVAHAVRGKALHALGGLAGRVGSRLAHPVKALHGIGNAARHIGHGLTHPLRAVKAIGHRPGQGLHQPARGVQERTYARLRSVIRTPRGLNVRRLGKNRFALGAKQVRRLAGKPGFSLKQAGVDFVKGFGNGLREQFTDTKDLVLHPVKRVKEIGQGVSYIARHPVGAGKAILGGIKEDIDAFRRNPAAGLGKLVSEHLPGPGKFLKVLKKVGGLGAIARRLERAATLAGKLKRVGTGKALTAARNVASAATRRLSAVKTAKRSLGAVAKAVKGKSIQTPSNAIKRMIRKPGGVYLHPLTDKIVDVVRHGRPLEADHIFPKSLIKKLPGFRDLTDAQKEKVLNYPRNFQALTRQLNASKGNKLVWTRFKGVQLHPDYVKHLQAVQAQMHRELRDLIDYYRVRNELGLP